MANDRPTSTPIHANDHATTAHLQKSLTAAHLQQAVSQVFAQRPATPAPTTSAPQTPSTPKG